MTGTTPDSLRLSWTVAQGSFDSFTVQYKDAQGRPQVVPVKGDENEVTIPGLESDRKYRMNLYGLHGRQRVGPVSVVAATGESGWPGPPSPANPQPTEWDLVQDPSHPPPPSLSCLQFSQSLHPPLPHVPELRGHLRTPNFFLGPASPSRTGPISPILSTGTHPSTPGCPPPRHPQPLCSSTTGVAGLLPLAQAVVFPELPLPAAHTLRHGCSAQSWQTQGT